MKKFVLIMMLLSLTFVLAGCNFLSTVVALKGFNDEYNALRPHYESSSKMQVSAEASITVIEASFTHTGPSDFTLSIKDDATRDVTMIDFTKDSVLRKSMILYVDDLQVEYLIQNNNITPLLRSDSEIAELMDEFMGGSFNFSLENMENQRKTGDRQYELDVKIDKFVDTGIVNAIIKQFGFPSLETSSFVNIPANVKVEFFEENYRIRFQVTMTNQRLELVDSQYAIVTIASTVVMEIPTSIEEINVFEAPYVFIPVDDVRLAHKLYQPNQSISLPFVNGQNGYMKFALEAGTYQIVSSQFAQISTSMLRNQAGEWLTIDPSNRTFTIPSAANYFFYVKPTQTGSITLELRKTS